MKVVLTFDGREAANGTSLLFAPPRRENPTTMSVRS